MVTVAFFHSKAVRWVLRYTLFYGSMLFFKDGAVLMLSTDGKATSWAAAVRRLRPRMRPIFTQERVTDSAALFIEGLLNTNTRKTAWARAEFSGDPGPWRQQAILGRAHWRADLLLDLVREYVLENFSDHAAVLVLKETHFPKQGHASCGVAGQFVSLLNKSITCQVGLFMAYASRHGLAFLDRTLYLPHDWIDSPDRREAAHIPENLGFASKSRLAVEMLKHALEEKVAFAWITASREYASEGLENLLIEKGKRFVLPMDSSSAIWKEGAQTLSETSLPKHLGKKGDAWSWISLADNQHRPHSDEVRCVSGMLIQRGGDNDEPAFFSTWAPLDTPIESFISVLAQQERVEAAFEAAKTTIGLDHNESRSWHGWYRHVTLAMLAYAIMAVECRPV